MKALAPNTLLQNRYLIVQLIGKGGMGEVYLGVDQRLGSAMAIKRTFFSDDETLTLAFEREAKTLARLRHPSLPKVSDHFIENEVQYLVMEHISGDDLSKRLEITNQPFPLNWVLFWADQLLDALAYLHSHEPPIIHRDIKPQNLKLTADNHIILLDFGLAKNSGGETRLSTSGSVVGYTPHYASMEQIRGTGTTARSDIYSLSATLYQLLTNTVPPDALSRADNLLNQFPDPVTPPHEINPEISQPISEVILKGMSLSSEQRYADAREMQKALRNAYAQIQNAMTAQTEAFNIADVPQVASQIPAAAAPPVRTEDFSAQIASQIPQSVGGDYDAPVPQNQTSDFKVPAPAENFDQTMPYDLPMTGAKTEIIPNGLPPLAPPISAVDQSLEDGVEQKSLDDYEDFGAPESSAQSASDASQATAVNFISLPKNESKVESYPPPYAPEAEEKQSSATAEEYKDAPPPPKKSNGKSFAVAGGIAALVLLGVAAAVVALFALKPSTTAVAPTPTPAPTVAATPEPMPEPTLQAETNVNTDSNVNTNGNPALTTATDANVGETTENNPVVVQNTPRVQTERPSQNPSARPTPRVITQQVTPKPPVNKPTPKPAATRATLGIEQ